VEPRLLILDEPVSSLDISIRAEILDLLVELQDRLGRGYLYISTSRTTLDRSAS
jgi:ABC-type dipeptide/oligopeptide/nickel transport system ATPase subunit